VSDEKVEAVERLIAAVNERDLDGYLACCTDGIQLFTPWAPIEGAYEGRAAIRRFFADVKDTLPDFRLSIERVEAVGATRVLVLLQVSVSGRASGIPVAAMRGRLPDASDAGYLRTATICDFAGGKIASIRVFLDRTEAFEAAGLQEKGPSLHGQGESA
jgi:ketosteroid isomerase-like protein